MMTKIMNYNLFIASVLCLIMSGCYKDKGNYVYEDVNPITIKDEAVTEKLFAQPGSSLQLNPALELNGNEDDLSFQWFAYLNSSAASYSQDSTLIATSRRLDYIVDPSVFTVGEDYKLTYKVTQKKTGVSYFYFYQLSVSDKYTVGWIFLEDKATKADLSMISRSGEVIHNIYTETNPDYPLKNPTSFTISHESVSDQVGRDGKRFYITTEDDAIELDGLTMTKRFDYNYLFFVPPSLKKPSYIGWAGGTGNLAGILINDGKLHVNMVGGFPGAKKFGAPLSSPQGDYDYDLASQTISGTEYTDLYQIFMFDKKHRRFFDVKPNALRRFDDAVQDLDIIDLNNVRMDLIKMDSSHNNVIRNAVMKGLDNETYLLTFKTTRKGEETITESKQKLNAPYLSDALDLTCSTLAPHIYYAHDGKLYRYEITSDNYTVGYTFPATEVTTKIKFQKHGYGNAQARLIACTWNGSEGKVYYFKVNPNGSIGELDKTFTGFGKIVDLAFKY
ncbi:hypothetical protein FAZ19_21195 [Sphingobacterium alkalisoli]|uniref:PKD-like family protein n=1 Tax=Sphingobacterium alkalisoli TaxID=1874115 RepID=A0A4V5LX70_9SPHI|nr:PKD-like family lipoprotein [Sphingobacterium alkalisoli]TJY61419.1 hypothetical protein FAZ19_21195 [Sphingobacterium alkalisoli]GGH30505.1 hypothetical protein GCM10011418_42600 [Sphingobacterium alkalisoli]